MKREKGKTLDPELEALWRSGISANEFDKAIAIIEHAGRREPSPNFLSKILAQDAQSKTNKLLRSNLTMRPILRGAIASAALAALMFALLPAGPKNINVGQSSDDALVTLMLDDEARFDDVFAPDIILLEALS
jgi:hypothetical protein